MEGLLTKRWFFSSQFETGIETWHLPSAWALLPHPTADLEASGVIDSTRFSIPLQKESRSGCVFADS